MNFIEKLIARKIVTDLLAAGRQVTVDYERGYDSQPSCGTDVDNIIEQMDAVDECWLMIGKPTPHYDAFIYFIWDNGNGGWDCITDYNISLEEILKPTMDFIDEEGD